jgi:hypothetical protein
VSFAQALVVGGVLVSSGTLAAVWRRNQATAMAAVPVLAAGAAVCTAGVTRFAAGARSLETGQELAALICVMALATSILGAAWMRGRAAR